MGTRPEAIKVAPLVRSLQRSLLVRPLLISTGQHGDVLDDAAKVLRIPPDVSLNTHEPGQTLHDLTAKVLRGLAPVLEGSDVGAVVVQGDTASALAGALAAFYVRKPVVHLEAGLRSGRYHEPYPEELHRRLITQLSQLHLAPTEHARSRLLAEGVPRSAIEVTGNTVVDALTEMPTFPDEGLDPRVRTALEAGERLVLATVHRRESWGAPLSSIARALSRIAELPGVVLVVPMHPNPAVRRILQSHLDQHSSVVLLEAQPYDKFLALLGRAHLLLTDSGGAQEEAPSFGVPALVMRDVTDRPEAVRAGLARLVGTQEEAIVTAATRVMGDPTVHSTMRSRTNPFGDGRAAPRCAAAIERFLEDRARTAHQADARTHPDHGRRRAEPLLQS